MTSTYHSILVALAQALYRKAGYIPFPWHIDDVRCVSEDREIPIILSDAECLTVLENARDNHDATIGMNWDVIEAELEPVVEGRAEAAKMGQGGQL